MTPSSADDYAAELKAGAEEYSDVIRHIGERGLEATFTQTGGMCAAIEIALTSDKVALATDRDGPLSWLRADHQGWAVGVYDEADSDDALTLETSDDGSIDALTRLLENAKAVHCR